ncbi:MAG TPA: tetratricopeptide repeat protein [Gemmatimonadales bacterium]|nr:tetratricopeptide repeat protein [Gemmatimonadales bacterium]
MTEPFRSSEEYDEQAHQLYNEGRYEEALTLLREGLLRHPQSVELHVGVGYAQLAIEQYAWARQAFELALVLDPEHEDALAGLGEVCLVLGQVEQSLRAFHRLVELGYDDDHELMLQVGRALFREGFFAEARRFFELARSHHDESAELAASLGYTAHRLGLDADAFYWLRRALALDPGYVEARVYLGNILYDRGDNAPALHHFARLEPEDHFDDLGVWRTIELLKAARGLADDDHPDLRPWFLRLAELGSESTMEDQLFGEIESLQGDGTRLDPHQLELFATLMRGVPDMEKRPSGEPATHAIETLDGITLRGSWDELLLQLQAVEGAWPTGTVTEFMEAFAARGQAETGVKIPVTDAEAFLRGAAAAGVVRILE